MGQMNVAEGDVSLRRGDRRQRKDLGARQEEVRGVGYK